MMYKLLADTGAFSFTGTNSVLILVPISSVVLKDWHLFWLDLAHSHFMIAVSASRLNYLHP